MPSKRGKYTPFRNRWRQASLTQAKPRKYTLEEQVAYANRIIKRANRAAGYQTDKPATVWAYVVDRDGDRVEGTVVAMTRSEARSLIKAELGIGKNGRLPVGTILEGQNLEPNLP